MASTKITGMSELITIQSQITMKANEFLSLFGLSPDKTLATIESACKQLPQSMTLSLVAQMPEKADLKKAISYERKLSPLISMYQEAVNEIYGQLHNFEEGEEKENVSDQLRRADLLVALLQCYFTFLWQQLDLEDQRSILVDQLRNIEKDLLNLEIDENVFLAINQSRSFRQPGNKKQAKQQIRRFLASYDRLNQMHRTVSQELFNCFDVQPDPPWFCLDLEDGQPHGERDYWRSQISHSMDNLMSAIRGDWDSVCPQRTSDGEAMFYSHEVARHLNKLHTEMQNWSFDSFLENEAEKTSPKEDLSLRAGAIQQLVHSCQSAEAELSLVLEKLKAVEEVSPANALPTCKDWVGYTYDLENQLALCQIPLNEATRYMGLCISSDSSDFRTLDALGAAIDSLRSAWSRGNKFFLQVRDTKAAYREEQAQNAKSSNFLERITLPSIPRAPWKSPAQFANWLNECTDLIATRRMDDRINLRCLRSACQNESSTHNMLKYVDTYTEGLDILRSAYLPKVSLAPDISRSILSITEPATTEYEELKYCRLFLNCFQQLKGLSIPLDTLGLPLLYNIISSLTKDSLDKWEEQSLAEDYENLSLSLHFEKLREFLKRLIQKNQSKVHKANLRRLLNPPSQSSPPPKKWDKNENGGGGSHSKNGWGKGGGQRKNDNPAITPSRASGVNPEKPGAGGVPRKIPNPGVQQVLAIIVGKPGVIP